MLGLASGLSERYRQVFAIYREAGNYRPFYSRVRECGFEAVLLKHDFPHLLSAVRELSRQLRDLKAVALCCHGYKADLLGWRAARLVHIPVVSVAHGWTGESRKTRLYEAIDRVAMRWMDRVVCVSQIQAQSLRNAGIAPGRLVVIRNGVRLGGLERPNPAYKQHLLDLFGSGAVGPVVCAAGRLSPEKGFDVLVKAAALVCRSNPSVRFVLFGEGGLRQTLIDQVRAEGLSGRFVLAGYRKDFASFLPHIDLLALPSHTEGLPCVVLEAFAAGVPVVASAVGGVPEVVKDGVNGYLVSPGRPGALAERILDALRSDDDRKAMGVRGRKEVTDHFSQDAQSFRYLNLFEELTTAGSPGRRV